ncbi:MAG: pyridoxamine 5'-phosphate oxidase family protein [Pseudomonadota bacterium]
MDFIDDIAALEAIYGAPSTPALVKVARRMTPEYRAWIAESRFCVLSTVGPGGADGSPRGDDGPVVVELDPGTLAMPDWRGNNRMDSLRNIVADGRVALMFMVEGSDIVVRVNGRARVTTDEVLRSRLAGGRTLPRSVIVIAIEEVYFQCARAIKRAGLWSGRDRSAEVPSAGAILAAMSDGAEGGAAFDEAWSGRAAVTMW